MNAAKCTATDYVGFLVTTKHSYSCPEAEKVQPEREGMLAHDAFTLLLQRLEPKCGSAVGRSADAREQGEQRAGYR